jgi:CRISPR-associated protein Cas2
LGDDILKIIITYDISDDKKRYKLAKELLMYGIRTQKSLFEASINEFTYKYIKELAIEYSSTNDKVDIYQVSEDIERIGNIDNILFDVMVF